ncbi:hypothetical protein C2869_02045 [Saccharobesus litoralis]|uniref:Uncharacterized protein n=1 Tax=Saccharobesus litoralis TaxID=2172099 RepID=A0A2S0VM90_9ALTE|nr:hypothetical protein [Saccharobesus litoralis]AWB65299.1 hypothetical protein C2869_02045 [Saccharobesus litoralis]
MKFKQMITSISVLSLAVFHMAYVYAAPSACVATGGSTKCGAYTNQQFIDGLKNTSVEEVVIGSNLSFNQSIPISRSTKKVTSLNNGAYDILFGPDARLNITSGSFTFSGHSDSTNNTRTIRFLRNTSISNNIVGRNKQIFYFNGAHSYVRINNVLVDGSARFIDMTGASTDLQNANIIIRHNTVRDFIQKAIGINRRYQNYTHIASLQIINNRFEAPALWEMKAINGPGNRIRAISLDAGNDMTDCLNNPSWSHLGNCTVQKVSNGVAPSVDVGTSVNPGLIQGNTFINVGVAFARYENILVGHATDTTKRNRFFYQ